MDKLQQARFDLFKAMNGKFIPNGVLSDIRYDVDDAQYELFKAILDDRKLCALLIVNDTTLSGYHAFWDEVYPDEVFDLDKVEFLLGKDYAEIKECWITELANFIRNVVHSQERPFMTELAQALYSGYTTFDIKKLFADMMKRQIDAFIDYNVWWCFCLVLLRFDLMTEELLPQFYKALEKHKSELAKF